jgi:hypothetical protein
VTRETSVCLSRSLKRDKGDSDTARAKAQILFLAGRTNSKFSFLAGLSGNIWGRFWQESGSPVTVTVDGLSFGPCASFFAGSDCD